jgi:ABC-type amino acid transport substrate-binding protein
MASAFEALQSGRADDAVTGYSHGLERDLSFVFPLDGPLRRRVNSALVALHQDGTSGRLREKWFGKE